MSISDIVPTSTIPSHVRFVTTLPPRWMIWGGRPSGLFRSYARPLGILQKGFDSQAGSKVKTP
ncbi:hypothetical protein P692DRAFT_2015628 [Suillus brevipes Sb2]|nr:hypothetical protein P692DRAFT_2015628 [Suillus brevipes Sb2]